MTRYELEERAARAAATLELLGGAFLSRYSEDDPKRGGTIYIGVQALLDDAHAALEDVARHAEERKLNPASP